MEKIQYCSRAASCLLCVGSLPLLLSRKYYCPLSEHVQPYLTARLHLCRYQTKWSLQSQRHLPLLRKRQHLLPRKKSWGRSLCQSHSISKGWWCYSRMNSKLDWDLGEILQGKLWIDVFLSFDNYNIDRNRHVARVGKDHNHLHIAYTKSSRNAWHVELLYWLNIERIDLKS